MPCPPRLSFASAAAGLLLLFAFVACSKKPPEQVEMALPKLHCPRLHGTWLHDDARDRGDTLLYRPNTYRFAARRGGGARPGFRFGPYGRFEQYDLAPAGGLRAQAGAWEPARGNRLRIKLFDPENLTLTREEYTLEVVDCGAELLKLRRIPR